MTRSPIPTFGEYRGIGLHDQQDEARLAVVRSDIDRAFGIVGDVDRLFAFVRDRSNAPEARLFAKAMIEAEFESAVEERRVRPQVDTKLLAAVTAGLATTRSPMVYDSIASPMRPPGARDGDPGVPVRRTTLLRR